MTNRPSNTLSDLTQNWPDDADNEDLARLGHDLFANRPELSQLALDRIQIRMRQEMNRPWWHRRWRTLLASILATIAIALGTYGWLSHSSHTARPGVLNPEKQGVQDHYQITLPPTSPKPPEKPLIDLQHDQDLFGKGTKEPKR